MELSRSNHEKAEAEGEEEFPKSGSASKSNSGSSRPSESTIEDGRGLLSELLRSIVMSSLSYTLFLFFNPQAKGYFLSYILINDGEHRTSNNNNNPRPNVWKKDFYEEYLRDRESEILETQMNDLAITATNLFDHDQTLESVESEYSSVAKAENVEESKNETENVEESKNASKNEIPRTLMDVFSDRNRNETKITSEIAEILQKIGAKQGFVAEKERKVETAGSGGRIDIAISRSHTKEEKTPIFGLIEVGMSDKNCELDRIFWKKTAQSIKYLKAARLHQAEWDTTSPVLLAVLALSKEKNDPCSRLAIFICEPNVSNGFDWRIALLWRKELPDTKDLCSSFARYVNALCRMTNQNHPEFNLVGVKEWKYLGPNCSKVTVVGFKSTNAKAADGKVTVIESTDAKVPEKAFVLRSYDNRVRQTSRSPLVYEMWASETDKSNFRGWSPIQINTFLLLHLEDGNNGNGSLIHFRDPNYYGQVTLFRADADRGQVKLFAVPFVEGKHVCESIDQAICIAKQLEIMHLRGLVHGDIRAFNIVFSPEGKAEFIDYDFAGETGIVEYPPGYKTALDDGKRPLAEASKPIEAEHDVKALSYVFWALHEIESPTIEKFAIAYIALGATKNSMTADDFVMQLNIVKDNIKKIKPQNDFCKIFTTAMLHNGTEEGAAITPEKKFQKMDELAKTP